MVKWPRLIFCYNKPMTKFIKTNSLYLAWLVALVATFTSLYLSEVRGLQPCILCWYQRIFMYPLALILPIGIISRDRKMPLYVMAFSVIGGAIAIYHDLLQMKIIPEKLAPCVQGVSCLTKHTFGANFITIPFLSLIAFATIGLLASIAWRYRDEK
jgi:disulfide bond formation protein DsbB